MAKEEKLFQASNKFQQTHVVKGLRALHDHVIVVDMDFEMRTLASGIVLLSDDKKTDGIRPRWARVWAVGPEQRDVTVGQWVLVEHGRWSRGLKIELEDTGEELVIRRADPNCLMMVSDEEPENVDTISDALPAQQKFL